MKYWHEKGSKTITVVAQGAYTSHTGTATFRHIDSVSRLRLDFQHSRLAADTSTAARTIHEVSHTDARALDGPQRLIIGLHRLILLHSCVRHRTLYG
jgi:hypothetical protein